MFFAKKNNKKTKTLFLIFFPGKYQRVMRTKYIENITTHTSFLPKDTYLKTVFEMTTESHFFSQNFMESKNYQNKAIPKNKNMKNFAFDRCFKISHGFRDNQLELLFLSTLSVVARWTSK